MVFARKSNVFLQYLWRYALIAVIGCLLVGAYFSYASLREVRAVREDALREKMRMALSDLNMLDREMASLAVEISIEPEFQPGAWQGQELKQRKMLEMLHAYRPRSVLAEEFFLVFHDSHYVFLSSGQKSYRYVYADTLGMEESAFSACVDGETFAPLALPDGRLLFLYPVRTYGYTRINGAMGFLVSAEALYERMQLTSGGLPSDIALWVNGFAAVGTKSGDGALWAESGNFTLAAKPSLDVALGAGASLRNAYLALIVAFVLALAVILAYRSYMPLRRLGKKYALADGQNEWEGIDSLLGSLLSRNEMVANKMKEQLARLKPQMLGMLLDGNCDQHVLDALAALGVALNSEYFALLLLVPLERAKAFSSLIADMTEEQIALYPVEREKEGCLCVLACMEESYLVDDAREWIESLLESEGDIQVRYGGVVAHIEEVGFLFAKMANARAPIQREALFTQMIACVRAHDWQAAHDFLLQLENEPPAEGEATFALESTATLVRIGREEGLPMDEVLLGDMMLADSICQFAALAIRQMEKWALSDQEHANARSNAMAGEVIEYIHTHYKENSLSLDSISAAFGVSTNTLYRLVKRETHMTYREYVVKLRIDVAKRLLLRQDRTVTEVASQVGYVNLSHFIKSFKALTGLTPAQYRAGGRAEEMDAPE